MPAHHAIHFFLSFLELLRMKNYGKKKSVYRGYCLSREYQYGTNGFSEHSYCILCRWGGVVTRDQLRHKAEEDMKVTSKKRSS
jgi:hypothetical protein